MWLSSIPMVFLCIKDFRKNEKGQQRSQRPNKGQRVNDTKILYFFVLMELLGVTYSHVSLFLSFKAKKVKKAVLGARNTKLQTGKFVNSKIVSCLLKCFNVLFIQIRTLYSKKDILKAKTYLKSRQNEKHQKMSSITICTLFANV